MRNLKRVLSTIMALAMLLSVVVISTSANTLTFDDQDKIVHREAVDMAVALKIILGYEDGTFRPEGNITRAEMTKMIAVLMHGGMEPILGTNPSGATFTDIRGHWAEKYIEYCVAEGIVAGMGDGTFDPDGNVTGTQAAKMLLVALGYRADIEDFNTSNWATRIAVCAADRKLFEDVNVDPNAALSRDNAAQMIWNALQAYEVEYVNEWYMDANGNPATRMVARDKTQSASSDFITLLRDKYNCDIYTTTLWETTWSKADKVFKYSFGAWTVDKNDEAYLDYSQRSYQSTVDYSDFFGMEVKVVVKNDGKTILGMVLGNSKVLAEAPKDLYEGVDGEVAIKVDGVKYRLDAKSPVGDGPAENPKDIYKVNDLPAFAINVPKEKALGDADVAYMTKLIDFDGDGRGDYAVYVPFQVAKVSSLNSDAVTVTRGGVESPMGIATSYDLADIKYYEGMAKSDYVVIYNAENTPYKTEVIEKMDTQEGELTRRTDTPTWYLDGTGYDVHHAANANIGNVSLGNEYIFYVVNGFVFAQELGASNYTIDDILFVSEYSMTPGLMNDRAKVYFAKDGTKATVEVSEIYLDGVTDTNSMGKVGDLGDNEGANAVEKLYTFTEKNGEYILTKIDSKNLAGFDDYNVTSDGAPNIAKNDGISASTSKTPGTLNGMTIDNDAVIFMIGLDSAGDEDVKVLKGSDAKDLSTPFGNNSAKNQEGTLETLTTVSNSRDIVKVALVKDLDVDSKLPSTGKSSFGYVVSKIGESRVDGTNYTTYTMYGENGDVFVYDEKNTVVTGKGDIVEFDDVGNNYVENAKDAGGKVAASLGMLDDGTIQFAYKDGTTMYNQAGTNNLFTTDDDTLILVVDTSVPKGIAKGTNADLDGANKDDNGLLIPNCYFRADSENVLELVVIDSKGTWNHAGYVADKAAVDATKITTTDLGKATEGNQKGTEAEPITLTFTGAFTDGDTDTVVITLPAGATAKNGAGVSIAVANSKISVAVTVGAAGVAKTTTDFSVTSQDGTVTTYYQIVINDTTPTDDP